MSTRRHLANAIRALSMDAVQQANSGHPGMPMGMADIAESLWRHFLKHNPRNPDWFNRDRFVLSNGHGSMLLYSLLHLTGYDVSIKDLQQFRQLHSKTAGHPEFGYAPGIETTTGPLGQGIGNAVGMALAEKTLAAQFNRDDHAIVDHYTYVFMGDGCLMEGISHEVCSLAGTLQLGKLIVFWDDNGISIDGEVEPWFSDNTPERFKAYGWQVITGVDGHDSSAVDAAIKQAQSDAVHPTLICCRTTIGYGAPNKAGTAGSHGAPLGEDEISAAKKALNWQYGSFEVPEEIYTDWDAKAAGKHAEEAWTEQWRAYQSAYPELAKALAKRIDGDLPKDWEVMCAEWLDDVQQKAESVATRKASQMAINRMAPHLPGLIGGSADLTGSNNTNWSGTKAITVDQPDGNYIYYGVREFGMCAIMNGLHLHGGFIPYGGTFLVFSDYARNAIRMAALMKLQAIYVFTHDSIGLGEDGPTHQPVEHVASLRMIPNLSLWRPCDAVETLVAWQCAIEQKNRPTVLSLSRQGLPHQARDADQLKNIKKGGYVLVESTGEPSIILLATGSEVQLAVGAAEELAKEGIAVRVVSMPSVDRFERQSDEYRGQVLPAGIPVVSIEAGVTIGWHKYTKHGGTSIGIDTFGESAPAKDLFKHFGFTVDAVVAKSKKVLRKEIN